MTKQDSSCASGICLYFYNVREKTWNDPEFLIAQLMMEVFQFSLYVVRDVTRNKHIQATRFKPPTHEIYYGMVFGVCLGVT